MQDLLHEFVAAADEKWLLNSQDECFGEERTKKDSCLMVRPRMSSTARLGTEDRSAVVRTDKDTTSFFSRNRSRRYKW